MSVGPSNDEVTSWVQAVTTPPEVGGAKHSAESAARYLTAHRLHRSDCPLHEVPADDAGYDPAVCVCGG